MNAAIRAVVRKAILKEIKWFGIYDGYVGMVAGSIQPTAASVGDIISLEAVLSFTPPRYPEFAQKEGQPYGIDKLKSMELKVSWLLWWRFYHGAMRLTEHGFPAVGVPGTTR